MLAVTVLLGVLGFAQDEVPFEVLATDGFLTASIVDPELGVCLYGVDRVMLASGTMAKAFADWKPKQRWRPVGRTADGKFWVVLEPLRFPLRMLGWDGTRWTEAVVVLDRRVERQLSLWKRDNAVVSNDVLSTRVGSGLFVRDRLGVYAYANGGRWLYRTFVPKAGKSLRIGQADQSAYRAGDDGAAYFYRREDPERIYYWDGRRWEFAKGFPSGLPAKYELVFRLGPDKWIGFDAFAGVHVADGRQTPLPSTQCRPLMQHPRDGSLLVSIDSEERYARIDADGNVTRLGPATGNISWNLPQEPPIVTESAVYWINRSRLLRWTKGQVVERLVGNRRLLGLSPDKKAVFAAGDGIVFTLTLAELDEQLDKRMKLEKHSNLSGTARLDRDGRMTRVHAGGQPKRLPLHEKLVWHHEHFADEKWHVTPDTPTYTTWHCAKRWCGKCHTKPRLTKLLQEAKYPMPQQPKWVDSVLRTDGTLVTRTEGSWKPLAVPARAKPRVAQVVRTKSGAIWLSSTLGLVRLSDASGKLAVTGYWLFDSARGPIAVDRDDNVWLFWNRELVRIVNAGDGRSP